jgi:hypothetical protein
MESHFFVHLFHILIVGGLFMYVGINRDKIPEFLFGVLFYLGIVIIFYHIYKVYKYITNGKAIWVNLIHIFIVGPLLILIGKNGKETSRKFFELLLLLGFASIGYHSYYLLD